ncbi:MAG: TetR/AcrR family transcriptional regulator [Acidimicrobiales bacterium]
MSDKAPGRRAYDATRRRSQAERSQHHVLDVAERLLLERGYAAMSIRDVAQTAGVSMPGVYATIGNKRDLLRRLLDVRLAGDEAPVPLAERDWFREMLTAPQARRVLELHAASVRAILERAGPLLGVLRQGAGGDAGLAEDYRLDASRRYQTQRRVAVELARRGVLRDGLMARQAADIIWTLSSPDAYELLVVQRSWTPKAFEQWLADTLAAAVLHPDHTS